MAYNSLVWLLSHSMSAQNAEDLNGLDSIIDCKPFLKWVGGKSQLLEELIKRVPRKFSAYHEPFLGGGALFFALQPATSYLSDINPELINAYQVVKSKVTELIDDLKKHIYEKNYYYKVRSADRSLEYLEWDSVRRASRIIFLNKTGFNGLYRVNSKGHYNVPFGRYTNPRILDQVNLRACSRALAKAQITSIAFKQALKNANKGDFVYFDPPYLPLNRTSSFTSYSKHSFNLQEQISLRDACNELDKKGIQFMLSNSATAGVIELYSGFRQEFVSASRAINSNANKRGKIDEIIVTNY